MQLYCLYQLNADIADITDISKQTTNIFIMGSRSKRIFINHSLNQNSEKYCQLSTVTRRAYFGCIANKKRKNDDQNDTQYDSNS